MLFVPRHFVTVHGLEIGSAAGSEAGQHYHEQMWAVIDTCKKHEKKIFEFPHESIKAKLSGTAAPSLLEPSCRNEWLRNFFPMAPTVSRMSETHTIRLRGPWHYQTLTTDNLPTQQQRVHLAHDTIRELNVAGHQQVRFSRAFGRPNGLESNETIYLVVEKTELHLRLLLNGELLGDQSGTCNRWNITAELRERNTLIIETELPEASERDSMPDHAFVVELLGMPRLEIVVS